MLGCLLGDGASCFAAAFCVRVEFVWVGVACLRFREAVVCAGGVAGGVRGKGRVAREDS